MLYFEFFMLTSVFWTRLLASDRSKQNFNPVFGSQFLSFQILFCLCPTICYLHLSVDSDICDSAAIILSGETFPQYILLDVVQVEEHAKTWSSYIQEHLPQTVETDFEDLK